MFRRLFTAKQPEHNPTKFRPRGGEMSRMEQLSDGVFAFSITLLIVALEVPDDFAGLVTAMQGFLPFALSFALLIYIWYLHNTFFREYGLNDGITTLLNSALLFLVVFFVYPLKFLADLIFSSEITLEVIEVAQILTVYGLGLAGVFSVFTLLHLHAYRLRKVLELNRLECFDTLVAVGAYIMTICIALVSIILAQLAVAMDDALFVSLASWIYLAIPASLATYWTIADARRKRHENEFLATLPTEA